MAAAKKKAPPSARIDSLAAPDAVVGEDNKDTLDNWAEKVDSDVYDDAKKLYKDVVKAYQNAEERDDNIEEFWNIQNAIPDANQQYSGNSQGYIPAVRDAIHARAKRALKQLFPTDFHHCEGISSDGKPPFTQLALLEYYIRRCNLKSIVRTDLIAGDVTGQWNLMIDWVKSTRTVRNLIRRPPLIAQIDGEDVSDLGLIDPTDEEEALEDEEVIEEGPEIIPFATEDLVVLPPTCNDLQKARAVSLKLRMSPDRVRELVDEGVFIMPAGKDGRPADIEEFCRPSAQRDRKNPPKKASSDAGVKTDGINKHALIYMVWTRLAFDGDKKPKSDGIVYFAGENEIMGIIRNPLWSGKVPILSKPVEKQTGSFFGRSKIEPVKFLQWNLNDFWVMGQDSAMYSLLPIFAMDPLKNPNWASTTIGLAAVLPIDPDGIKPITFPQMYKESAPYCDMIKRQIWESMEVNEMMMGKMPSGRKNNQMMGAMSQEQQTNITDHASRYEEEMLNPLLEMLFEFDQQYRTAALMVEQRGEIGVDAALKEIPVPQWEARYQFRWTGTEFMMNMQRSQQQIAFTNVLKGIPPQMMGGLTLDLSPVLLKATENLFGAELAPKILVDKRNQYAVEPEVEDEIMHNGMPVAVHKADDDQKHLQSHMRAASVNGDPLGIYKEHMGAHMMQIMEKRQTEMGQQQQAGLPGTPGGAGPGVPGAPRPGALPAPDGQRPGQNPPGAIQQDNMQGAPGRG